MRRVKKRIISKLTCKTFLLHAISLIEGFSSRLIGRARAASEMRTE